jgi:NAD-dependent deacetylase
MRAFLETGLPPACDECGGWIKPDTVSFGQAMPEVAMGRAKEDCRACDLLIAAGSSLAVHPAAGLPLVAKEAGARFLIVNRNETALDDQADGVIYGKLGELLPRLAEAGSA